MNCLGKGLIPVLVALLAFLPASGQILRDNSNREVKGNPNKDKESKEEARAKAKKGIRTWTVNEMSGLADSVATDTMSHSFQNTSFTDGERSFYNNLGNIGSPRLAKVFSLRPEMNYYIFTQPYDFFIKPMGKWHFTNTYSPITNITYHECGSSENGEDHLTAKYAVNINKDAGLGFSIDYIYGRGYHDAQSTADFGFNFYGSVIKDQYKAHWLLFANYLKTHENGGITDDQYVTDPQKFPSSYTTKEIPVNLNKVWNKMHINGAQLTHRYSLGFRKIVKTYSDSTRKNSDTITTAPVIPAGALSAREIDKKQNQNGEETASVEPQKDSTIFIPVTSVIHTFKLGSNSRKFLANQSLADYYTNNYLGKDSVNEHIDNVLISNYLALELSEGLNKYLSAGIRIFGQHDFNSYKMPGLNNQREGFTENRISIGAQIFREQSPLLNYLLTAQTSSDGKNWGEFELRGVGRLTVPLFKDSVALALRASTVNRKPTFFYRHYQSNNLWWDNDNLSKQLTTNIGATLESKKLALRLKADAYTISNYTYFCTTTSQNGETTTLNTEVAQSSKNINILALALEKDFVFGPLHWENSVVWQSTSNKYALPLPAITAYTNLFLKFRIAKVLNTEFGADVRYFTKYYAPTYSVALGQFATQAPEDLTKVGNHPVISAYVNFHLKHTRFYLMVSHLNYNSEGGTTFGAPHYPINPMVIRFGLSWNFFN